MTTKHTPGPWHITKSNSSKSPRYYIRHTSQEVVSQIAEVDDACLCKEHEGDGACNARLIAAAPELLECLTAMTKLLFHNHCRATGDLNGWADKARAAIRKATGEA
jgi:hypothetical protein